MGSSLFALRRHRLVRALGRNPLIRTTDRIEAFSILLVLVIALLAIPFAAQTSDTTYEERMRTISEQTQTRHSVEAVAVADSMNRPARYYSRPVSVRAEWREGTQVRTELVATPTFVKAGAPVTVWLDDTGKVVPPPDTARDARSNAAGKAWAGWIGTVGASMLLAFGIRRMLDRSRNKAWERELQLLAHNDDGWANRYP